MATWQFSVVLLPKKWAERNEYDCSSLYDNEGYDTEVAWIESQPVPGFREHLSNVLPKAKSWCDDLECWGNEKENDIQVWFEGDKIDGIHVRLDVNQDLNELIVKLVILANTLNCAFFYPELKRISEANVFELKKAVHDSNADKFVKDQRGFLSDL